MSVLSSVGFYKDTAERALKTFAQSLLAAVGTGAVLPAVTDVDWAQGAAIGLTAAVISILTSIVSSGIGDNGSASLVPEIVNEDPKVL